MIEDGIMGHNTRPEERETRIHMIFTIGGFQCGGAIGQTDLAKRLCPPCIPVVKAARSGHRHAVVFHNDMPYQFNGPGSDHLQRPVAPYPHIPLQDADVPDQFPGTLAVDRPSDQAVRTLQNDHLRIVLCRRGADGKTAEGAGPVWPAAHYSLDDGLTGHAEDPVVLQPLVALHAVPHDVFRRGRDVHERIGVDLAA